MSSHQYLQGVLSRHTLTDAELNPLREAREHIEGVLRAEVGSAARFYYGGSFAKRTMLRSSFDLDIIVYVPSYERATLRDIFEGVHRRLVNAKFIVAPRTVALRLPYQGGFHIDVVPGKAQDGTFRYATLYKNSYPPSSLQTSLKVHIESIKDAGLGEVVQLVKLWRSQRGIDCSTFALEIAVQRAMFNVRRDDLAVAFSTVLEWLSRDFVQARLVDPANSNNIIDVPPATRLAVATAAAIALRSTWGQIVS